MAIELTTQDYLDLALADLEQTRAENERLTDCLEETIDELLCGNRLHAQLLDGYNICQSDLADSRDNEKFSDEEVEYQIQKRIDATDLLNSAQGTINRLRQALEQKEFARADVATQLFASEQARLDAVRTLRDSEALVALKESRLTKAEEALAICKRYAAVSSDILVTFQPEIPTPKLQALAHAIADTRLAEWLAIHDGKTRLEYKEYIEQAREFADFLVVIGYKLAALQPGEPK